MWPFTSANSSKGANAEASSSKLPSSLPAEHPATNGSAGQCPVDHTTRSAWLAANNSAPHPLAPETPPSSALSQGGSRPGLLSRLSNDRVISSIPRASSSPDQPSPEPSLPHKANKPSYTSQDGGHEDVNGKWVYPSEQQFFNAMMRKNHNPQARDMRTIVPIHNAVNEKAWEQVLMWEAGMGADRCGGPRLVSFVGRPKERTPKAWIMTALGYTPPFDRHDWLVDRCGTNVRYVIDFYTGRADPNNKQNMAFYLDVRPAVDNWEGVKTRVAGWWR